MPEMRMMNGERGGRSQTPSGRGRISGQKHRRSHSSKSSITIHGSPAKRPMSRKIMPEDFPAPATTMPEARFDAYLRVRDSWQPSVDMSPNAGSGHQYLPLKRGDVILQHTRYPSGWSYGQTLTTGAYGFLPANHCEPYYPREVSELLEALQNVWTCFGAQRDGDIESHMIQDNVSGMLKGVRGVLKQLQCLEGDAVLVRSHAGIWKMRKSLLGDFHVFVKASKMLQELHQSRTDTLQDRQLVLVKGCKVAMRAVRFLDMWNTILDEQLDLDAQMYSEQNTPSSVPTTLPTSIETGNEYPFPVTAEDQSSVHPAFRTPNARVRHSVSQQLPHATWQKTSPQKITPTRGATRQLGELELGARKVATEEDDNDTEMKKEDALMVEDEQQQSQHDRSISRDLPGLISGLTGSNVVAQSWGRGGAEMSTNAQGSQRSHMPAARGGAAPAWPAKWSQRDSSLTARGRIATNAHDRRRLSQTIDAHHNDESAVIAAAAAGRARAQTPAGLAQDEPDRIDRRAENANQINQISHQTIVKTNQSPDTTPTRTRQQQVSCRRSDVPLARIDLNGRCPSPPSAETTTATAVTAPLQSSTAASVQVSSPAYTVVDAPTAASETLASHKLSAAHDAFLALLGLYIAGHLKRRSTMDLYRTTYDTSASCQSLLDVVLEIWQRDGQQSTAVDRAAQVMRAQFAELYDVTSEILKSSAEATTDADAVLAIPNNDDALTKAATNCARSAGDCVLKTRAILARLGDFRLESSCIGSTATTEAQSAVRPQYNSICARLVTPDLQTSISCASTGTTTTLPDSSSTLSSSSSSQNPLPVPSSSHALPPLPPSASSTVLPAPPQQQAERVTTLLPAILSSDSTTSSQSTPTPTSSARHDSHESARMPSPIHANRALSSSLNVSIPPPLSPVDIPEERASFSSTNSKITSADSLGASVTNSTSTRVSSFRHSAGSYVSTVSTRATTPDKLLKKELHDRTFNESFTTLASESTSLSPEEEAHVENLLAAETHVRELVTASDGSVTGGTLQALVEKLTPFDTYPDSVYLNTFYLTFRLFTTPTEFAQTLIDRFNSFSAQSPKHVMPARLRVYNIFKGWIDNHWHPDTDAQALPLISEFAHGPLQLWLSSPSKRLIEVVDRLQNAQNQPIQQRAVSGMRRLNTASSDQDPAQLPLPQVSKAQLSLLRKAQEGGSSCNVLNFDALELARHLTIIESRLFCAIEPEELLGQEWNKKTNGKGANVRAMSSLTNDIVNLVADTILQFEEPKKRASAIKHWVHVAQHCQELGNYNIIFAICGSLATSMIHRLEKTWSLVSPKTMAVLQELQDVIEARKNYATLRKRLQAQNAPCIPFIGMFLTDLTFVDVGNDSIRQVRCSAVTDSLDFTTNAPTRPVSLSAAHSSGGIHHNNFAADGEQTLSVINFDKYAKTARIIGDLLRFQKPYRLQPVPELMDWIERQLARVRASKEELLVNHDRRSKQLEPRKATEGSNRINRDVVSASSDGGIEEAAAALFGQNGSGRGRLQWLGKMNKNFASHRDRSGS